MSTELRRALTVLSRRIIAENKARREYERACEQKQRALLVVMQIRLSEKEN